MTRVLITGAAGFIGANLVARCLADDCDVYALVRPGSDCWRLSGIGQRVHLLSADVRDRAVTAEAVTSVRPDWIFHAAGHGAYSWHNDRHRMLETNITGTANLLDACAAVGFGAFINAGTSSEYGRTPRAATESDTPEPTSPYAVSKLCATQYCRFVTRDQQLPITTLRLYSAFGPFEDPGRLMPTLIVRGLAGRLPPLAEPAAAHDFVYVDDVCDAFVSAARHAAAGAGAVYNVGTGVQTTLATLVALVQSLLAVVETPQWRSMPARAWDSEVWVADPTRMAADCGWRARHSLAAGLTQFVEGLTARDPLRDYYARRCSPTPPAPAAGPR